MEQETTRELDQYKEAIGLISDYFYFATLFQDGGYRTDRIIGAFEQLTGYSFEEMEFQGGFFTIVKEADLERIVPQAFEKIFRSETYTLHYQIRRKDGQTRWVKDTVKPLKISPDGKQAEIVGVVQDITMRKYREAQTREALDKFSKAFNIAAYGLAISSLADGRFIDVNEGFAHTTGYGRNEIIGKSAIKMGLWAEPEQRRQIVGKLKQSGLVKKQEIVLRTKDQRLRTCLISAQIVEINNQECLISSVSDITWQRNYESELLQAKENAEKNARELKEAEERLKLKLDYVFSPESPKNKAIQLTDIIDKQRLQNLQDAFVKATGVASLITNTDGVPITEPSNFSGVCRLIRQTEKGRQNCFRSDKLIGAKALKTGKPFFQKCYSCGFIDAGAPIVVGGKAIALWMIGQSNIMDVNPTQISNYAKEIGADEEKMLAEYAKMENMSLEQFQNVLNLLWLFARELSQMAYNNLKLAKKVSEQKDVEKQLTKAKEAAEESNHLKTAFLNNISHEFRTPMNGIMGFAQLITKSGLPEPLRKSYSEAISQSCERLLDIVTDTVEMAQFQTKTMKLQKREFLLGDLLREVVEMTKPRIKGKNEVELEIDFCKALEKIRINTDRRKLLRSIVHLLDNAIKFTHKGFVKISCRHKPHEALEFEVQDTGIGISPQMKELVFQPFRQQEVSLTRRFGGSGIGLSLVKAYIEMLGGNISLESEINKGTKIRLVLPAKLIACQDETKENCPPKEPAPTDWSTKTILIAEDERLNYIFLEEVLADTRAKILYAENGQQAVDMCRGNSKVDLILMDLEMPELDGYQATQLIKGFRYDIPVLAQTAYAANTEDIEKIKQCGCDDYIAKPIRSTTLIRKIQAFFE